MTEPELTAEELALLESHAPEEAAPAVTEEEPAADAPKRRPRKRQEEPQVGAESPSTAVVVEEPAATPKGPHDHPLAPPVQHSYDDPWGLLPIQMRHDAEGRPAF